MTQTIDQLRSRHEELKLRHEVSELERIVHNEELASKLVESSEWGSWVNPREAMYDTPGWGYSGYDARISSPHDRKGGKCTPFFETEQDLAMIRGIGRYLAGSTEVAVGALENLTSFTIGTGFSYEVAAKTGVEASEQLVATVQTAVDEIIEANQWTGDQEEESFRRAPRDGETLLWARDWNDIRIVEPDYLTEPSSPRAVEDYCGLCGLEWTFGVATDVGNPTKRHGYFIQWEGSPSDWDFAPAREAVHIRLNVDRNVKRGISDFYAAFQTLDRATKLLGNTLQGAAIQAAIAYIREHVAGTTSAQVTDFRGGASTRQVQQPLSGGGSRTVYQQKFNPGTIIDTVGTQYKAGPLGQSNAPIFVDVLQAALRIVGARWAMPEYMISGDASNANYSSTLVAGGPFDRATQRRQSFYKRHFEELLWKCLAHRIRRGEFLSMGIGTVTEMKRLLQIKIDAPEVAIQDKKQQEEIMDSQQAAGILSPRTRAQRSNLDYDLEVKNGARPQVAAPSPVAAALESVRTTDEAKAILESYP